MSFRAVRQSKFRHVFGKEEKRDMGYDGIKISRNAWDSNFCDVNAKFVAVILEAQGGGSFLVLPLEATGRVELNHPTVCGHTSAVLEVKFCPFNDNMIASCGEDCLIKIWDIPDGGLKEDLRDSLVDLEGHQRRVGIIEWHPTAENVLLSAGFDYVIFIWDLGTGEAMKTFDMHPDAIFSVAWNFLGTHIVTACKDKKIRYIDARSGEVVSTQPDGTNSHDGTKAQRALFVGDDDLILSTGFSKMSERQYALWDPKNMAKPKKLEMVDTGSGVLFCQFDPDTNVVWMSGKGDGNIRYFEIDGGDMFYLSEYKSSNPQRGVGWLPKLAMNVNKCEVGRAFKLHPKGFVEVISFTVPRKSTLFQDDLYPPTKSPEAVMTAEEWLAGKVAKPKMVSMADNFVPETRTAASGGLNGPGGGGGLNAIKKGGLNAPKKPTSVGLNKKPAPTTAKPAAAPAAAPAPAPVVHAAPAAAAAHGGGDRVAELEDVIVKKDAEIKELKKHLATLEIKLREYESQ